MSPIELGAILCRESYRPDLDTEAGAQARTSLLRSLGYAFWTQTDGGWCRAFAAWAPDQLDVVIEGTNDIRGLIIDGDATLVSWRPRCLGVDLRVHKGLLAWWMAVAAWVRALDPAKRKVRLIGHSAGGAAVTFAAVDWLFAPIDVLTYGSPRCGSPAFAAAYNSRANLRTIRTVHDVDLVPQAPPAGFYAHVAGELMLASNGDVIIGGRPELEVLRDDIDGEALADHSIDTYIAACAAYAKG